MLPCELIQPPAVLPSCYCLAVMHSYGVSQLTYGLAAHPCRDCPFGMQTSTTLPNSATYFATDSNGKQGFPNPMACVTKAGYGYNGRTANKCPKGSWNPPGNYNTCTECQTGLSTPDDTASQVSEDNCTLAVGYGYHDNTTVPCPIGECFFDMLSNGW